MLPHATAVALEIPKFLRRTRTYQLFVLRPIRCRFQGRSLGNPVPVIEVEQGHSGRLLPGSSPFQLDGSPAFGRDRRQAHARRPPVCRYRFVQNLGPGAVWCRRTGKGFAWPAVQPGRSSAALASREDNARVHRNHRARHNSATRQGGRRCQSANCRRVLPQAGGQHVFGSSTSNAVHVVESSPPTGYKRFPAMRLRPARVKVIIAEIERFGDRQIGNRQRVGQVGTGPFSGAGASTSRFAAPAPAGIFKHFVVVLVKGRGWRT